MLSNNDKKKENKNGTNASHREREWEKLILIENETFSSNVAHSTSISCSTDQVISQTLKRKNETIYESKVFQLRKITGNSEGGLPSAGNRSEEAIYPRWQKEGDFWGNQKGSALKG